MKLVESRTVLLIASLVLTGCGEKLPKTINHGGMKVEVVGEAWEPAGTSLQVLSRPCPWNATALAAYRVSGDGRENICLIFRKDGTVDEAHYGTGSLPIRTEEFGWASGWPGQYLRPSRDDDPALQAGGKEP